jgi:hypothetical protein
MCLPLDGVAHPQVRPYHIYPFTNSIGIKVLNQANIPVMLRSAASGYGALHEGLFKPQKGPFLKQPPVNGSPTDL